MELQRNEKQSRPLESKQIYLSSRSRKPYTQNLNQPQTLNNKSYQTFYTVQSKLAGCESLKTLPIQKAKQGDRKVLAGLLPN